MDQSPRTCALPLMFFLAMLAHAQPPVEWQHALGGTEADAANAIHQTADGGYVMAGLALSHDGDVFGNHGEEADAWVVKLDDSGNIQWQKALGGSITDVAEDIHQTVDGGYIMAGYAVSNDGDVSGNHGWSDAWVVKLDDTGNIQWQKALGGTDVDIALAIQQTTDSGYIMAGYTLSNDGDVSGNHGDWDAWVVKLDNSGNIQWKRALGGTDVDAAYAIKQTGDGGYVLAGYTLSNDGDVAGNHGWDDAWVVKLDDAGNIQWQKLLGGTGRDEATAIQVTADGGFVLAGYASSNDGDVSGNHGMEDAWVVKLDDAGNIQWQRALGGTDVDEAWDVQQTSDGGYIMAGYTTSNDGDVSGNHGIEDTWVAKLDSSGAIQWQKALGGTNYDAALAVHQVADGGYVMAAFTFSNDGNVSGNHGDRDAWVVKLGSDGTGINELPSVSLDVYPDPTTGPVYLTSNKTQGLPTMVSILDATGRVLEVDHEAGTNCLLDLGRRQSGVYLVKVMYADGSQATKRVVKE